MHKWDEPGFVNIGTGEDISIAALAETVKKVIGFEGEIIFDTAKPDGTPRKLMDISKLAALGWTPSIQLEEEGIKRVYAGLVGETWY